MTSRELLEQLERSRDLGFLGDGPLQQHVEHGSALLEAVLSRSEGQPSLLDLGSGGGVPGLLAVVDPRWGHVALLDRSERRCAFLRSAVSGLGVAVVGTVAVACGPAERLGHSELREAFDAVVCRSFGPPAATLECAAAFCTVGGHLVISDPPSGRSWPEDSVNVLGLDLIDSVRSPFAMSVFAKVSPGAISFPRREGVPFRRPLFEI